MASWHPFINTQQLQQSSTQLMPAALYILDDYAFIEIIGPEAAKFLQGQLSCDVAALSMTQSGLGSHSSAKGRMHSSFRIFHQADDSLILRVHQSIAETALQALAKYIVFSKASIAEHKDCLGLGVHGADAQAALKGLLGDLPKHSYQQSHPQYEQQTLQLICVDQALLAYEVYGPAAAMRSLWQQLSGVLPAFCTQQQQLLQHHLGLAFVQAPHVGQLLPQMLNYQLLPAISFTKGCYTGQEIVARMHYLGKNKRQLYRKIAQGSQPLSVGDEVFLPGKPQACGQLMTAVAASEAAANEGVTDILLVLTDKAAEAEQLQIGKHELNIIETKSLPYAQPISE